MAFPFIAFPDSNDQQSLGLLLDRRFSVPTASHSYMDPFFENEAHHFIQATMLARRLSLSSSLEQSLMQPRTHVEVQMPTDHPPFPFMFPVDQDSFSTMLNGSYPMEYTIINPTDLSQTDTLPKKIPALHHSGTSPTELEEVSEAIPNNVKPEMVATSASPEELEESATELEEPLLESPTTLEADPEPGFDVLDSMQVHSPPARNRRNSNSQESTRLDRFRATDSELQLLTAVFAKNPFPSASLREKTAEKLGLTSRQVQFWFQNRRATLKSKGIHVLKPKKGASTATPRLCDGHRKRPSLSLLSEDAPFFFVETSDEQ
ncbi:UNVERIFIED_CONTAM: hypothetical protein HDU68_003323 [Siphonaria sp. JEL0065]|nr:hypothetical protein HDU68_003323 [Siphonaria sp. JEL0065]